MRRAGLPKIRLHDLRHTYATVALGAGVHPKIVSERLGHATIAVTLDLYSHVTPAIDAEAAALVASKIFDHHRGAGEWGAMSNFPGRLLPGRRWARACPRVHRIA